MHSPLNMVTKGLMQLSGFLSLWPSSYKIMCLHDLLTWTAILYVIAGKKDLFFLKLPNTEVDKKMLRT